MIPQIQPWIDEDELEQLKRVVESTYVTESALTAEFEALTRNITGAKHAIAVMNGTMGLFCCLKSLDIGPGDEVIVPDMTFIATANAVLLAGATPVFCDIDPKSLCLDPGLIEEKITSRTKAVMPVHLYGQAADMDAIVPIALKHNLSIIEDAAQGIGVTLNGQHVGTFGDLAILSYYGNKTLTTGEGGIILTNDDELAKACYRLKNHGRDSKGVFKHETIGYNFSFTEMQAAIGIAQMHKLDRIIARKGEIEARYRTELAGVSEFIPMEIDPRVSPVFWFTSYFIDEVDRFSAALTKQGIQTRRFFYPLHKQPCYQGVIDIKGDFPVSARTYERGVSLPSSYQLTDDEQTTVIHAILDYFA